MVSGMPFPARTLGLLGVAILAGGVWEERSPPSEEDGRRCEIVMVRTCYPRKNVLRRFERLVGELPGREVVFSFNKFSKASSFDPSWNGTKYVEGNRKFLEILERVFGRERVVSYTDEALQAEFPSLKSVPKFRSDTYRQDSLAYIYHDETVILSLLLLKDARAREARANTSGSSGSEEEQKEQQQQHQKQQKQQQTKHPNPFDCGVWVLEDDLEYTGDWKQLLDKYSREKPDLVSSGMHTTEFDKDFWRTYTSQQFRDSLLRPDGKVWKHEEHLVYYSPQLLAALEASVRNGSHAQSEIGTATFARFHNFSYLPILNSDKADGNFYKNVDEFHTHEEVRAYVEELKSRGVGKLVHPAKF